MALTPHDTAIWHTCHLNELADSQRLDEWSPVPRTFATQFQGERVLTVGPFRLLTYSAVGDGSYVQDNSSFFATGRYGAALTIGTAVGRAAGNASRRSRAAGDATPRWRAADAGQVYISTEGFYLASQQGFYPWNWGSIQAAHLAGPGQLSLYGDSSAGPVHWVLCTDWAELAFTLWARARQPEHPQLLAGRWIPPGWAQRVRGAGIALPVVLSPASPLRAALDQ